MLGIESKKENSPSRQNIAHVWTDIGKLSDEMQCEINRDQGWMFSCYFLLTIQVLKCLANNYCMQEKGRTEIQKYKLTVHKLGLCGIGESSAENI